MNEFDRFDIDLLRHKNIENMDLFKCIKLLIDLSVNEFFEVVVS